MDPDLFMHVLDGVVKQRSASEVPRGGLQLTLHKFCDYLDLVTTVLVREELANQEPDGHFDGQQDSRRVTMEQLTEADPRTAVSGPIGTMSNDIGNTIMGWLDGSRKERTQNTKENDIFRTNSINARSKDIKKQSTNATNRRNSTQQEQEPFRNWPRVLGLLGVRSYVTECQEECLRNPNRVPDAVEVSQDRLFSEDYQALFTKNVREYGTQTKIFELCQTYPLLIDLIIHYFETGSYEARIACSRKMEDKKQTKLSEPHTKDLGKAQEMEEYASGIK